MKKLLALVAITVALSMTSCTKKDASAPEGSSEQVEGTTVPATPDNAPPTEEMQQKKDDNSAAPAAAPADNSAPAQAPAAPAAPAGDQSGGEQ